MQLADEVSLYSELLDRRVRIAESPITHDMAASLMPEEQEAVSKAVASRRAEFAAGRSCARRALNAIGLRNVALPVAPDRTPCWPQGVIGSITHTADYAAAAVARRRDGIVAVGIDLETLEDLDDALRPMIMRPAERAWLDEHRPDERGILARTYFSAKECAFKCQFTLSRTMMEFEDFEIALDLDRERFTASFTRDVPPFEVGRSLHGAFRQKADLIATTMVLDDVALHDLGLDDGALQDMAQPKPGARA